MSWLPMVLASLAIIVATAIGRLKLGRDFFFLFLYAQSVVYLDIAPSIVARGSAFALAARYEHFQWLTLALFQLPFLLAYLALRKGNGRTIDQPEVFLPVRGAMLFGLSIILALGYFAIGARYGLLYRRAEHAMSAQLELSILEFAIFRSYTEFAPFLIALQLLVVRRLDPKSHRWARVTLLLSGGMYMVYALINSRMMSATFVAVLFGVFLFSTRGAVRFRASTMLATCVALLMSLYSFRVASNLRQSVGTGGALFSIQNFLPFAINRGVQVDPLSSRLNGLDLVVLISPNLESTGPAWGGAWAVPILISLDPIVRTEFTLQAKRVALTTSKSFLLLMYAGLGTPDYYSCVLSDAYGNFGRAGFLIAALILALVLAFGSRQLRDTTRRAAVPIGLFFLIRALPFEQEFGSLLFGWFKAAPILLVAIAAYPLRETKSN